MRWILIPLLMLAMPNVAHPQVLECQQSERFGARLLEVGDSERKVRELEPDRRVRLETVFGGAAGWRYDFYKRKRTVQVYVRDGVVIRICRVPD